MKHTRPDNLLNRELLCFVRNEHPTVVQFTARFGGQAGQVFHVLRKSGVLIVNDEKVCLNPQCLAPDAQRFLWGNQLYHLRSVDIGLIS